MTTGILHASCRMTAGDIAAQLSRHVRRHLRKQGYRYASVLMPLWREEGQWMLLLTRRNNDLPHHQGQIAFPGGSIDEGESVEQAALREAAEEICLQPSKVQLLGCHDDIWTPSGFIITPVIGVVNDHTSCIPNPDEVARLFSVPLCFFSDEANAERRFLTLDGAEREVYYYQWDGETIWGATALMIRNFLSFLSR
jgi:8-oxo-dGTP pyrophosphatase MutT (NUDIX family)